MSTFHYFGIVPYTDGLALQEAAFSRVCAGAPGEILGLSHPPVFTFGRRGGAADLYVAPEVLAARGIGVIETERGGGVTYHGPEQVVLYPVLSLGGMAVKAFSQLIEAAMLGYLAQLGIVGSRKEGAPGVFVGEEKIGFLGLRIRHGVSTHGCSLNLCGHLDAFSWMNPCGYKGLRVTSVERLTGTSPPRHEEAARGLAVELQRLLGSAALWRSV